MLSGLVIGSQKFILVIDEVGQEKISQKFLCQLLREQGQDEITTKILPITASLKKKNAFNKFIKECSSGTEDQWNVILPPLSDLLCYQRAAEVFQFLHRLRICPQVKRFFLWATRCYLMQPIKDYLIAGCEHMSDLVLHMETADELSITTKKQNGNITHIRYTYNYSDNTINVEPVKKENEDAIANGTQPIVAEPPPLKPEEIGTHKIELEEDELVARNSLKLPYEKTSEDSKSNVVYTPEAHDDLDDEDPDEDLCM